MYTRVVTGLILETYMCSVSVVQGTDQVLPPLCQAVVHGDLFPLGDVSDGDNDQPHLAATVDFSDAAVRGGREGAGCWGWSRGCRGRRSCGRGGQRWGLS